MVKEERLVLLVGGVDHFDVDLGVLEGGFVEILDVVEEVAGEGGVGLDGGGEAEVVVVVEIFLSIGVRWMGMGIIGMWMGWVLLMVKMRRLRSSRVAAGMVSLLAEMNWMRASSRERAGSESLVMMTRTGSMPCWT